MRQVQLWGAFLAGMYVLQSSLLPLLAYHGVTANLMLLVTVSFSFLQGYRFGVFLGFCAGLLQDLATGTFFGCNILSYMLVALACGKISDRVFKEQFFLPILASVFATACHYFLWAALVALMGYHFRLAESMQYTLVPMLFYQLALAYPVHQLAYDLDRYASKKK